MAEVLAGPARTNRLPDVQSALHLLDVRTVALSHDSPARLPCLRATTSRRLADCGVLLAAKDVGATIATFDQPLARNRRRTRLRCPYFLRRLGMLKGSSSKPLPAEGSAGAYFTTAQEPALGSPSPWTMISA